MKKTIAMLAIAGLAAGASAQSDGLSFVVDGDLSPGSPTTTVHLFASFPASDYAFAGVRTVVSASESGWGTPALVAPGGTGPGTSAGAVSGADVTGIIAGQLNFPIAMIYASPTNPIEIWKADFTTADFTARSISLSTTTADYRVYPAKDSATSRTGTAAEAAGSITVVPAPASLALLGLGGLAAARRRR